MWLNHLLIFINLSLSAAPSPPVSHREPAIHSNFLTLWISKLYPPERPFSLSLLLLSKRSLLPCCVPITPRCHKAGLLRLIAPAGERERASARLIKMLMCLKGDISLPGERRLGKSALLNSRLFHLVKVALSPLCIATCSSFSLQHILHSCAGAVFPGVQ